MVRPTRRNFLTTTSLLAAGAACGTFPGVARAAAAGGPKLGIQLYSLRGYSKDEAEFSEQPAGGRRVEGDRYEHRDERCGCGNNGKEDLLGSKNRGGARFDADYSGYRTGDRQ